MFSDDSYPFGNEPPKRGHKRTKLKTTDEAPPVELEVKPTVPVPDPNDDEVMPTYEAPADPNPSSLEGPMGVDLPITPALPLVAQAQEDEDLDPYPEQIIQDPQWHIERYMKVRDDLTRDLIRLAYCLQRAQRDLPYGQWTTKYLKRIRMNRRVASRIIGILKNKALADGTHKSQVPDSYMKLSKLADLSEEQTLKAINDGRINPTMTLKDAEKVLHDYAEPQAQAENQPASEPEIQPFTMLLWNQDSFNDSEPDIFHERDNYPNAVIVYIMPRATFFAQSHDDRVIPLTLKTEAVRTHCGRFMATFNSRPVYLILRGDIPNGAVDLTSSIFDSLDTLINSVETLFPTARKVAKGVESEGWEQVT